ncbi:MAG TPA: zinc ribbon domain-containing protein [Ktedonosporobacter sp.]|nr:zinc ribbon domain-containing protein [Ktedonosporobacter sp.]
MSCQGDQSACLISNIFGNGYKLSTASAYVVTTSFDTQLMGPVERSTDQPLLEWDWNIFPKSTGWQVLNVGIALQWAPTGKGGGTNILRQLWESPVAIEVNKPFIDVGQLSVSTAVTGVFGAVFTGVSFPWMLEQRRQKREDKKKKSKYCRYCGAENSEDFAFCNKCGKQEMTQTGTSVSAPPTPSSPGLAGDQQSVVGNMAGVQQASASGSSKQDEK